MRPDVIPQLADAAEVLRAIDVPPRGRDLGPDPERARARQRARAARRARVGAAGVRRDQRLPQRDRVAQPRQRQPLGRGVAARPRGRAAAGARGGPALRGRHLRRRSAARTRATSSPSACSQIAERLVAAGAQEIGFGDTTGMANPLQVRAFFEAARARLGDSAELTAHFHNTRGQGLANVLAALAGRLRELRVELRRARRLPGARRRDGQHRDRGPRIDAGGDGHRDRRSTSTRCSSRRARFATCSGARSAATR